MIVSMHTYFDVPGAWRTGTVGLTLALFVSGVGAATSCPTVITTPAGSAFDMASLIADNGSPQAALAKLRSVLSKLGWGAHCTMLRNVAACDETVELAKRAVAALEACAAPTPPKTGADKRDELTRDRDQSARLGR
ncbi:hypothetical protein [Paraburkholderia dilworthii]|uniref:hypothetical protein n=1 Tax=Paraburkholderia dilworthii TaxID=948106 RepID=UPI0003F6661C|nr:hypothetical protein [Paraburkholderia dilworthii]